MLCKDILAIWNHYKDFSWYTQPKEREKLLFSPNEEGLDEIEDESKEDQVEQRVWENEEEETAQVAINGTPMKNEESMNEGTVFALSLDSDDAFVPATPSKALTKEIRQELTRIKDLSLICHDQCVSKSWLKGGFVGSHGTFGFEKYSKKWDFFEIRFPDEGTKWEVF